LGSPQILGFRGELTLEQKDVRKVLDAKSGGERGIRTLGMYYHTTVFETATFSHSAISPIIYYILSTILRDNLLNTTNPGRAIDIVIKIVITICHRSGGVVPRKILRNPSAITYMGLSEYII
jgi:hypothetical protein